MKRKFSGVINVDQIPALNQSFIPQSLRDDVQDLYYKMENFYNRYQLREIKKSKKFNKFSKCYFCICQDGAGASSPFAKVFIEADGTVVYEIIGIHLKKLNLTPQEAEILTIKYIYRPVLSNYYDCWFSIFTNIDAFFSVLENEISYNNSDGFTCKAFQIDIDFEKIGDKEAQKKLHQFSPDEIVHVFDDGIVIIIIANLGKNLNGEIKTPEPAPEPEKKVVAEKKQILNQPVQDTKKEPINIENVMAFKRAKLDGSWRKIIIDMYNEMSAHNDGIRKELNQIPIELNIPKFETAKVFMGDYPANTDHVKNGGVVEMIVSHVADVYLNDEGVIDYSLIPENKLGYDPDVIDGHVSELILSPKLCPINLNVYSVLETPDIFMKTIEYGNELKYIWIECKKTSETVPMTVYVEEKDVDIIKKFFNI